MIITIYGENSFGVRRRLNDLINAFTNKNGELALEKFDAEESETQSIIESIKALPFLSPRKMVVVRNGAGNSEFAGQIEQIIGSFPSSTDLILYEPKIDKRSSYFKMLQKHTKLENYPNLDKAKLAKWLVDEAKKQNSKLSLADASYLVERLGENQEMLFNELSKLAIYDSDISKENINLLTEPTPQSKVFDLLDAAFGGQKSKALELYADQRAQKVEPAMILAMIGWQLRLMSFVKLAGSRKPTQIAKDSGVNPYPLNKARALASKISDKELKGMVDKAAEIDIKSKTAGLDLDEALKTYIVTI